MKTLVLGVLFLAMPLEASTSEETTCFRIGGMTCSTCGITLKVAVKKLDGILSVSTSVNKGSASVTFDPSKTDSSSIAKKINGVGYKATKTICKQKKGKKL